jgi:hypothetical protein
MKQFITRTGTLAVVLLSLTWLCRDPDWEPLIAFIVALTSYLSFDYWQSAQSLSNHDQDLSSKFQALFTEDSGVIYFLRDHDIAVPFRHDYIRPLFTFHDTWKGVAYEFDDKKLEKSKQEFIDKLKEYVPLVANETYPHRNNPDLNTMDFHDFQNPPEKLEMRDRINRRGNEVHDEYEKFIRIIRSKTKKTEQGGVSNG